MGYGKGLGYGAFFAGSSIGIFGGCYQHKYLETMAKLRAEEAQKKNKKG